MKSSCIILPQLVISTTMSGMSDFPLSNTVKLLFLSLFLVFAVWLALLLLFLLFLFVCMNQEWSTSTFCYPICNINGNVLQKIARSWQSTGSDCIFKSTFQPNPYTKINLFNLPSLYVIRQIVICHQWHLAISFRCLHEGTCCVDLVTACCSFLCKNFVLMFDHIIAEFIHVENSLCWISL